MTAALETEIARLMEEAAVPGLSVAQVKDGMIIWSRGFGVKSTLTNAPVTPATVFEAASLSKPVCAYGALRLCEQGILHLDRPLADALPEPYLPDEPRLQHITLRHVLSHVPGFPNWRPEGEPLLMHFDPGARFSYSGEGYVYLQRVIEHVTAQPLADYLATNVLQPLAMTSSSYVWTEPYEAEAAQGHDEQGKPVDKFHPAEANAAASLHTTPTDFARFMLAIMQASPDASVLLGDASLREMLRPQIQVNDSWAWQDDWPRPEFTVNDHVAWGLGWGIQHHAGGDTFWHWGDNGSFKAYAVGSTDRRAGVIMMSNSANGGSLWAPIVQHIMGEEQPGLAWLAE